MPVEIKKYRSIFVSLILSLMIVRFDPFNLEQFTNSSINDFVQRAAAPSIADFNVKSTLVTIDEISLETMGLHWPVAYAQYGAMLDLIAIYKPKAIFLDVVFLDKRNDPTFPILLDTIELVSEQTSIVLVGRNPETDEIFIREDLLGRFRDNSNVHFVYPLQSDGRVSQSTYVLSSAGYTAAQVMYNLHCNASETCKPLDAFQKAKMEVLWPAPHEFNCAQSEFSGCKFRSSNWIKRVFLLLATGFLGDLTPSSWEGVQEVQKLGFPELSAARITGDVTDEVLWQVLEGQFVFIGSDLSFARSTGWSALNGQVVSAAVHAAAFENLVEYNDRYWKSEPQGTLDANSLQVSIIVFVHFLFAVIIFAWKNDIRKQHWGMWVSSCSVVLILTLGFWFVLRLSPYWIWTTALIVIGSVTVLTKKTK